MQVKLPDRAIIYIFFDNYGLGQAIFSTIWTADDFFIHFSNTPRVCLGSELTMPGWIEIVWPF
jgi:hypothetical protein